MAKIKKACKGVSYPKSSSVSGRLGSPSKAKTGTLVPSSSSVSRRLNIVKKAAKGTSLGMKSVKAGYDNNPSVTRADIIVAAKGQAKKGMKIKKAQKGVTASKVNKQIRQDNDSAIATYRRGDYDKNMMYRGKVQEGFKKLKSLEKSAPKQKMGGKTKKCAYGCK